MKTDSNTGQEVFYRYEGLLTGKPDSLIVHARVSAHCYYVLKRTPKGVWVSSLLHYVVEDVPMKVQARWVSTQKGNKRFAHPTKEEALNAYIIRKKRHAEILSSQLETAKMLLCEAEFMKESLNNK